MMEKKSAKEQRLVEVKNQGQRNSLKETGGLCDYHLPEISGDCFELTCLIQSC